jgi:putative aldouronate transport system substrate-binding protein
MAGKSGVAFMNSVDLTAEVAAATKAGYTLGYAPDVDSAGHYAQDPFINNGVAISSFASKDHQERSMMMLDLLMQDPAYDQIAYFGIEGKNFNVNSNGAIAELDNTYTPDASGFWFTSKTLLKPQAAWNSQFISLQNQCKSSIDIVAPLAAFTPDTTDPTLSSELSNINTVFTQYFYPIYLGQESSVDTAFSTLNSQLSKAGIDDAFSKIDSQIKTYLSK